MQLDLPSTARILIVKLGAVGDVVHALYALRALRRAFPNAVIDWVVEDKSAAVIQGHPDLDKVFVFERKKVQREKGTLAATREIFRLGAELKAQRYDAAIDFQALLKSGLLTRLSGAKIRIGFSGLREGNFLFTNRHVDPGPDARHAVEKYMALVKPVAPAAEVEDADLSLEGCDKRPVDEFLNGLDAENAPILALNPGASWEIKRWPVDRFSALADRLVRESGARILVIWGPGEEGLASAIVSGMKERGAMSPPTDLKQMAYLLSRCAMYIGSDSGPMHIAAIMRTPVVALFGPSDPGRVAPYRVPSRIVENTGLDCLHCWKRKCRNPRCIAEIPVEQVFSAAMGLLKETRGK